MFEAYFTNVRKEYFTFLEKLSTLKWLKRWAVLSVAFVFLFMVMSIPHGYIKFRLLLQQDNDTKVSQQCDVEIYETAAKRKEAMLKACQANPELVAKPKMAIVYCSVEKWKICYFTIHKNAHTTAGSFVNGNWEVGSNGSWKRPGYPMLSHGSTVRPNDKKPWSRWTDHLKFTFINEPLVRIVSGFIEKLHRPQKPLPISTIKDVFKLSRPNLTVNNYSDAKYWSENKPKMDELFQYMVHESDAANFNPHWRPQFLFWPFCEPEMFDFIGLLPNLCCEMDFLARNVSGLKDVPKLCSYSTDSSRSALGARADLLRAASPELVHQVVIKHYLADYKILGYELPDFDNWNATVNRLFGIPPHLEK